MCYLSPHLPLPARKTIGKELMRSHAKVLVLCHDLTRLYSAWQILTKTIRLYYSRLTANSVAHYHTATDGLHKKINTQVFFCGPSNIALKSHRNEPWVRKTGIPENYTIKHLA